VHEALALHSGTDARGSEQIDSNLLEDTSANTTEDVFRRLPLENDCIDAGKMQKLPEEQSRGAGTDDRDLSSHFDERILICIAVTESSSAPSTGAAGILAEGLPE
jgi:hypothetical protein